MKFYVTSRISENIHETPEGYLVCVGVSISRTGEMTYMASECPLEPGPDGKVIVSRDEDEVFAPEAIASFQAKAITITHPADFVSPENWNDLAKGTIQNVRRGTGDESSDLLADLMITDSVAINLVKAGLREVSCGYEAEWIQTKPGRGIQRKIVGNHLALVDQGRAGSSYAINDHKGERTMKVSDRIKAIFAKAQDEAMKVADESMKEVDPSKSPENTGTDSKMYDAMMANIKDLSAKMDKLMPKDASASENVSTSDPAKPAATDEPAEGNLESRLKALEAAVAKLLESAAPAGDADEEEEGEADETGDADEEEEEGSMVGDTASRIEILAPGLKATGKDAKVTALKAAYKTTDGKSVIDSLTGGKPAFDKPEQVSTLFVAASEVLKMSRSHDLSSTKRTNKQIRDSLEGSPKAAMSADQINAINAKHYGAQRA